MGKVSHWMLLVFRVALVAITIFSVYAIIVIHLPRYRLMSGEILASGFINEILSLLDCFILLAMFKQREVTKEEIQEKMDRFEKKLLELKAQQAD